MSYSTPAGAGGGAVSGAARACRSAFQSATYMPDL